MKKNKILAGISALVMGATMMAGTAMSASADSTDLYALCYKNGSTTEVSMMQCAFTDAPCVYDEEEETLTFTVQSFTVHRLFVTGTGYLTSVTLYVDSNNSGSYNSGDTLISVGTVSPSLTSTSPSTLTFTGVSSAEYAMLQGSIVDAEVSYDLSIISGSYIHSDRQADFTLNSSYVPYT